MRGGGQSRPLISVAWPVGSVTSAGLAITADGARPYGGAVIAGTYRLGVDLGTSSTVAALAEPSGRVRPLLFDASPLLPSAVYAAPGGPLFVGSDAERAAATDPAGLEPNPKRRIDEGTVWLGEREVAVADLLAALLDRVAAEARRVAGRALDEVVLTHPASWASVRLGILADAATRADLGVVRFVPEPVAAATYFATVGERRIAPGRCIVVYDLGAGTFDVSVLRPHAGGFETLATAGLDDVGGLDLDAAVITHARAHTAGVTDAWRRLDWPQTPADQRARQQLWSGAKATKEHLSRHAATDLHVPIADMQVHVTREELVKLAHPHLDRTAALTLAVLQDAAVPPELIGGVYLVGGASRMPLAATLLHRTLRIAPTVLDHPELVVAEGALHAAAAPTPVAAPTDRGLPPDPGAPTETGWPPGPPAIVEAPVPVSPAAPALPMPAAPAAPAPPMPGVEVPAAEMPAATAVPVSPPPDTPAEAAPQVSTPPAPDRRGFRRIGLLALVAAVVLGAVVVAVTRPWNHWPSGSGDPRGSSTSSGTGDSSGSGEVIFADDFESGDLGDAWRPVTGRWSVTGGQLSGVDPMFGQQTIMLSRDMPADVAVSFRTMMLAKGVAELMLHVSSNRYVRVYLFGVSEGVYLGDGDLAIDGGADGGAVVSEKSRSVAVGTWYHVTVTARGARYIIAVNGSTVMQYDDTKGTLSPSGRIGLTAHGAEVRFDDVEVRRG
jgi:hypothetical protein